MLYNIDVFELKLRLGSFIVYFMEHKDYSAKPGGFFPKGGGNVKNQGLSPLEKQTHAKGIVPLRSPSARAKRIS
jgi:hypothetical protein